VAQAKIDRAAARLHVSVDDGQVILLGMRRGRRRRQRALQRCVRLRASRDDDHA
jgi:hypothetical protein